MEPRQRRILHAVTGAGVDLFQEWIDGLKDIRGIAAIAKRIERLEEGLFGDHRYDGLTLGGSSDPND